MEGYEIPQMREDPGYEEYVKYLDKFNEKTNYAKRKT